MNKGFTRRFQKIFEHQIKRKEKLGKYKCVSGRLYKQNYYQQELLLAKPLPI